jgi:hypothetical protein
MGQFDQLTDAELARLSGHAYQWCMRFYDAAQDLMTQMTKLSTLTPEYRELEARANVIREAGKEQGDLLTEVGDTARYRAERREAAARLAVIDLGDDETWSMIREAQDIDDAGRRSDPLMMEG